MFTTLLPRIYRRLRTRADLTQEQLAAFLEISKSTVSRFESGKALPDSEQEKKLLEVCRCSKEQLAEMACEEWSKFLGKRVAIVSDHRPATALGRARAVLDEHGPDIPDALRRVLRESVRDAELESLAFEGRSATLAELTEVCREAAGKGDP